MERCFEVRGKVQNVMFRQTVIRAMIKRGLEGGASNDKSDKQLVRLTVRGENETIEELVELLRNGTTLNDWGAHATEVSEIVDAKTAAEGKEWEKTHQVTTANVDTKNWNPNVTMFI